MLRPRFLLLICTLWLIAAAPFSVSPGDVADGLLHLEPAIADLAVPVQVTNGGDERITVDLEAHSVSAGPAGEPVLVAWTSASPLAVDRVVLAPGEIATLHLASDVEGAPRRLAVTATVGDTVVTAYRVEATASGPMTVDLDVTPEASTAEVTAPDDATAIARVRIRAVPWLGAGGTTVDLPAVLVLDGVARQIEVPRSSSPWPQRVSVAVASGTHTSTAETTVWPPLRSVLLAIAALLAIVAVAMLVRSRWARPSAS